MNEFPDKENIINLTTAEINDIYTLIDNTKIIELKNLCKKYKLKCSTIKVKELKIFLKEFFEKENQGKFDYTEEGLKAKKLPELKKIMQENALEIKAGDKKNDLIKKILTHLKKSKSRSKSRSKSPTSKKRSSVKHKFKKNDRVFFEDINEYGTILNYNFDTNMYTVVLDDTNQEVEDVRESQIKHISSKKSSPKYSAPKIPQIQTDEPNIYDEMPDLEPGSDQEIQTDEPNIYDEMPDLEPEYLEENHNTINETEIEEDTHHINIEDIPHLLKELQNTSVEDIIDNNVRITELIKKCLLIGIA
jgi:hypothetical protein